jgi:hypothetical protein
VKVELALDANVICVRTHDEASKLLVGRDVICSTFASSVVATGLAAQWSCGNRKTEALNKTITRTLTHLNPNRSRADEPNCRLSTREQPKTIL